MFYFTEIEMSLSVELNNEYILIIFRNSKPVPNSWVTPGNQDETITNTQREREREAEVDHERHDLKGQLNVNSTKSTWM